MCTNLSSISEKISRLNLYELGLQSGFIRSTPQKIYPTDFVLSFMLCIGYLRISLSDWANKLMLLTNISVSKQAIDQRTAGPRHVKFAFSVLQSSLLEQLSKTELQAEESAMLTPFNRLVVQDSSCIKLPRCLWTLYEGSHSKTGKKTASARIQLTADLKKDEVLALELKGYRDNDQSYSDAVCEMLQAKDLVLRDQGYFVLDVFEQITKTGAYFLSRLKPNVNVYQAGQDQVVDLLKTCQSKAKQGYTSFEMGVEIGAKHRLPVRLIVEQLPEQIYRQRRRKALKNRHKKAKHSKKYLDLLRWQFMITNAPHEALPSTNAYKIYRLRWRIEIFFKCWKSQFNLQRVMLGQQQIKASRAQIMIYLYLAYLVILFMGRFMYMARLVYLKIGKLLSISKWARMVATASIDNEQILRPSWIDHIARAASYEVRSDRKNHLSLLWEHLFA